MGHACRSCRLWAVCTLKRIVVTPCSAATHSGEHMITASGP